MSKINPGSNFNEDNDVLSARPEKQGVDIIDPTVDVNGTLHCPICNKIFRTREDYISHALSKHQTDMPMKEQAFLVTVPYSVGFHFFVAEGRYTGETAVSLATFAKDVKAAPIESIDFHFKRADFQKWVADTIGDKKLAKAIDDVDKSLSGEILRLRLLEIINARVMELENQP